MPDVPHLAFPLRFRAGRFLAVEQGERRHLEDQAEVLLRTPGPGVNGEPGALEASPDFGLRELVARSGPTAPEVLAALARYVDASFSVAEGLPERVRNVAVAIIEENREG